MQLVVKDVLQRGGYRAVECFGSEAGISPSADACCLPVEFLQRVGFRTARGHARHPRMRLDLKSVVSWREEVELAWERLLGAVRPPAPLPVPRATRGPIRPDRPVGPDQLVRRGVAQRAQVGDAQHAGVGVVTRGRGRGAARR